MPLTEEDKKLLEGAGFKFLGDKQAPDESVGFTEAVGISAGRALPSTAGALGAAGLAARAHPLLAIPAAIAGGIGGEALFSKAGEMLFPEELKSMDKATAQARKEQAAGSFIGEVLPSLISLKPSPSMVAKAVKGLRSLLTRKAPTAAQKAAMVESGLGAGIETGVELGQQLLSGEDMNIPRLGLAALTGSTLTPNKLGQKLFNMGSVPDVDISGKVVADTQPPKTAPSPVPDTVMLTDKDGNVVERLSVVKPTGIELVESRKVLSPERLKQAQQIKKTLPGFGDKELAAMEPDYASSLTTSYEAAIKRFTTEPPKPLQTSLDIVTRGQKSLIDGDIDGDVIVGKLVSEGGEGIEGLKPSQIVSDILRANQEQVLGNRTKKFDVVLDDAIEDGSRRSYWGFSEEGVINALSTPFKALSFFTQSPIDKLRKTGTPINTLIADAFSGAFTQTRRYHGQFYSDNMRQLLPFKKSSVQKAWQHLHDLNDTGVSKVALDEDGQQALAIIQKALMSVREEQNRIGLPVKEGQGRNRQTREGGIDPNYAPHTMSQIIIKDFTKGMDADTLALRRKEFIDYHVGRGLSEDFAAKSFDQIRNSFKASGKSEDRGLASSFGPLDKAEGIGLPPSWRDMDFYSAFNRYMNRVSNRLAFFDNIERHGWAREVIGLKTDPFTGKRDDKFHALPGSDTMVKDLQEDNETIGQIVDLIERRNLRTKGANTFETISRATKSAVLGPVTGARDLTTGAFIGFQHLTPEQVPAFLTRYLSSSAKVAGGKLTGLISKGMRRIGAKSYAEYLQKVSDEALTDWAKSLKKGVNTFHVANFEQMDALGRPWEQLLNNFSDRLNTLQGRSFFDQTARAAGFVSSRWAFADMISRVKSGKFYLPGSKKQVERQLEILGGKNKLEKWRKTGVATEEELDELAAKFVDSTQGTYDANGLPLAALDGGPLSGLLSLNRWSIEKYNNFDKYVVQEARNGNYMPAFMMIGALLAGGEAINQVTKLTTGREPIYPELKETMTAAEETQFEADELFYTLAAYAQIAGIMGVGGEMLYRGLEVGQSKGASTDAFNFFAVEQLQELAAGLTDVAATTFSEGASAEEKSKVFIQGMNKVLLNRVQGLRVLRERLGPMFNEDTSIQARLRNQRRIADKFNYLYNYSQLDRSYSQPSNRGMFEKAFKQTQTVGGVKETLKPAIESVVRRTTGSGQSPQALKDALSNLGGPPPSSILPGGIDRDPFKSEQFLRFTEGAEGEEAQKQLLRDFLKLKQMNELKRSIVPKP